MPRTFFQHYPDFDSWFRRVIVWTTRFAAARPDDLVDQPYLDWYHDEMNPRIAATRALKSTGWAYTKAGPR